jgi:hypothetical protein
MRSADAHHLIGAAELGVRPMKTFITLALCLPAQISHATSVEEISLKELVLLSDNIWGGQIQKVRMENSNRKNVTDPEAMTGPGLKNTIYVDVVIDPDLILLSTYSNIPKTITIPLWRAWHNSLGGMKFLEGTHAIFLLDENLNPAYSPDISRPTTDVKKLRALVRKLKPKKKTEQGAAANP